MAHVRSCHVALSPTHPITSDLSPFQNVRFLHFCVPTASSPVTGGGFSVVSIRIHQVNSVPFAPLSDVTCRFVSQPASLPSCRYSRALSLVILASVISSLPYPSLLQSATSMGAVLLLKPLRHIRRCLHRVDIDISSLSPLRCHFCGSTTSTSLCHYSHHRAVLSLCSLRSPALRTVLYMAVHSVLLLDCSFSFPSLRHPCSDETGRVT